VDSISWARDDSIVIGCVRLNEDNGDGYLVQVIKSEEKSFLEVSWFSLTDCLLSLVTYLHDVFSIKSCPQNLFLGTCFYRCVAADRKSCSKEII
jgi:nuclear pore complex protein Nup214